MNPPGFTSDDTSFDVIHLVPFFDLGPPALQFNTYHVCRCSKNTFNFTNGVI